MQPYKKTSKLIKSDDHPLIRMILNKGYNRRNVAAMLGMSPNKFEKSVASDSFALTVRQLHIIAGLINMTQIEVYCLALNYSSKKLPEWYHDPDLIGMTAPVSV